MGSSRIKIFTICLIVAFFPAIIVFAQQKKAQVSLNLYVNPVLYSEIKNNQLIIENNSGEIISVYEGSVLIYENAEALSLINLALVKNNQYSIISAP